MKTIKYRVVTDSCAGFEIQVWRLWFPFWVQKNVVNTYFTLETALKVIDKYKTKGEVVYTE